MALGKVQLRVSPLSRRFNIVRMGKDPSLALEAKDVTSQFWKALIEYSFDGKMPAPGDAVEISMGGGDEQFVITIERRSHSHD